MIRAKKILATALLISAALLSGSVIVRGEEAGNGKTGGGYSVTGQAGDVGYTSVIYDASNGLPTSDANYILGSSDGCIWIGSYSGIIRYDGNTFTRLPVSDGLTNGRGLFEDSKGRIWVGTNDNGVVVLDGNDRVHLSYKEGLPSSSIRVFSEDDKGNVFIGTTDGLCYADTDLKLHIIKDTRIRGERILRLDRDPEGKIYGYTKNGLIFCVENKTVSAAYTGDDLGTETITTIKSDPHRPGDVYLGTDSGVVYHGRFGEPMSNMEQIQIAPLNSVHWISYDCNRIWIASTSRVGYLDENGRFRPVNDIPMDSGIEMMTSDYQGNMWFASSTLGVMKTVTDRFVDISQKAGIPQMVTNAVCDFDNKLYVGCDMGLKVVDDNGYLVSDDLARFIGTARVRCITRGADDDLWVGTFTQGLGIVHLTKDGRILSLGTDSGMPDNEVRCICVQPDGTVAVGTNKGVALIREDTVVRTYGTEEGLENTVILSLEAGDDGSLYAGTDGDGIYVIDDEKIGKLTREDGLTSDVIMRIKKDAKSGLYWLVTSNSIEYMKDGKISAVSTFPYNNNYDLIRDRKDDMWVISSSGIYAVSEEAMIGDSVSDHRFYSTDNGLISAPTSQGYSELDEEGYLYIPCRTGLCRVNVSGFSEKAPPLKVQLTSVYCADEEILPDPDGKYTIPSSGGRTTINVSVPDYTLYNPVVSVYFEGREEDGITVPRNRLTPLEYAGLEYGDYILCVRVLDSSGKNELQSAKYRIIKAAGIWENPFVRLLIYMFVAAVAGFIVWRVMKSTIIRNQYEEIKRAKEEAERANTAKSRFLANMSHEIRTPINTIMGMNEMAMREDPAGVPKPYFMSMMNYAFDIRKASESLLSLINDLLDMSKIESGKMHLVMQEYDTADMIRSIVSMIRVRSTEKELSFDVVVDELIPSRLYGDQGKIRQIVLNLLTNAVKYTDNGGLVLGISMDERDDDECKLVFSVKDTGIGIKEEDMDRLFTAYERLDEQKNSGIQGTGLGLDISRRFAELMGGSLTCTSRYGQGSEFVLTLTQKIIDKKPVGVFVERDGNSTGPYVPQFIAPDADVLVVDDNPVNLSVIKGLLKGTKVFVSTAASGEECLEKIKDTRFDVILLDHMMPGMDGVETVAEIRKDFPDIPVYALTANTALGEDFYRTAGFDGYLPKPIDSMTLEKTIMKHLPEEKMEKPAEEDAVAELTEIPENLKWIYDTEGINVPEGIRNSGGISSFIFALGLFLDTIDQNAGIIRDSYENGNIRLYTIKVHSLKSSARIIGAMELSKLAEALEDAGGKEDKAFIDDNNDRLLSDYEAFKDKLARIHDDPEGDDKEEISEEDLKMAYQALDDVIPQMDYDAVESILEQLGEYALPEEDEKAIKDITAMLRVFDWDGIEELMNSRKQ